MAFGPGAAAAGEQAEAVAQPRGDLLGGEDGDPGRRQFDRQRHPVQPDTDLRHRRGVLRSQGEGWHQGAGALQEERHGGDARQRLQVQYLPRLRQVGHRQGWHGEVVLPGHAQRDAAGHETGQPRAGRQQGGEVRGGGDDLFEVVQEQQGGPVLQVVAQGVQRIQAREVAQAQRPGDRRQDPRGVAHRCQVHEPDAVGEGVLHAPGDLQGQPRLADARGPGEGEEADLGLGQKPRPRGHLFVATDEGPGVEGKHGPRDPSGSLPAGSPPLCRQPPCLAHLPARPIPARLRLAGKGSGETFRARRGVFPPDSPTSGLDYPRVKERQGVGV